MGERALGRAQLHDAKRESGHRRKGMQLDRGAGRKERCERHGGLRIPLVIPGRPKAEPGIHNQSSGGIGAAVYLHPLEVWIPASSRSLSSGRPLRAGPVGSAPE
jgi:hypothetical protein